jgi:AraC-like DNA-binding protein
MTKPFFGVRRKWRIDVPETLKTQFQDWRCRDMVVAMLTDGKDTDRALAHLLLQRLKPLASSLEAAGSAAGVRQRGAQLFGYCCVARERLARISAERPRIGVVLSGEKEFWLGDCGQRFVAGDVFVLPADVAFDVVNIPSDGSGLYESLLVEIERIPTALQRVAARMKTAGGLDMRVRLTADLVDALSHAAILLNRSDHATALAEHRLTEVLMLLAKSPAAACLFSQSLAERIAWLIGGAPSERWPADRLAAELGISSSTLRRKLTEQGTSLRDIQAKARMQLAHAMLVDGQGNLAQAASAAGYSSRSHFARRFRQIYGRAPAEVQAHKERRG